MAIFGQKIKIALILRILAVFWSTLGFLCIEELNVFVETVYSHAVEQFYFLTQSGHNAWAIAFALWPFLVHFQNALHFPNISCFLQTH